MFFELLSSQYAISIHTVGDFFLFRTVGDLECNSSLRGLIYNILESAINIYVRTIKGWRGSTMCSTADTHSIPHQLQKFHPKITQLNAEKKMQGLLNPFF